MVECIRIKALENLANALDNTQVDDLVYDNKSETLQLSAKGKGIGNKVSVREMLDDGVPVVDLDFGSDSDSDNNTSDNDDCDCGCENNVVEFGDVMPTIPNKDNNVVEF